jgi:hypothetical protein
MAFSICHQLRTDRLVPQIGFWTFVPSFGDRLPEQLDTAPQYGIVAFIVTKRHRHLVFVFSQMSRDDMPFQPRSS